MNLRRVSSKIGLLFQGLQFFGFQLHRAKQIAALKTRLAYELFTVVFIRFLIVSFCTPANILMLTSQHFS